MFFFHSQLFFFGTCFFVRKRASSAPLWMEDIRFFLLVWLGMRVYGRPLAKIVYILCTLLLLTLAVCRRRCDGMPFQLDSHHITSHIFYIYLYVNTYLYATMLHHSDICFAHTGAHTVPPPILLCFASIFTNCGRKKRMAYHQAYTWSSWQKFIPFSLNLIGKWLFANRNGTNFAATK